MNLSQVPRVPSVAQKRAPDFSILSPVFPATTVFPEISSHQNVSSLSGTSARQTATPRAAVTLALASSAEESSPSSLRSETKHHL